MLKVSESLRKLLSAKQANPHNVDLIERVLKWGTDLELQVNVSPAGGELVDGTISTYTDGIDRWHSFRIPKNSYNEPTFDDYKLRYDLAKYVDCIGSTGWLWKQQKSLFVAFDFDSIEGHASGVGIADAELDRVRQAVSALDYVEVRRSTGGAGLHVYVHLDIETGPTVANHNEHAAVARCILSKMSEEVGFDLCQHVDVVGSNTWFWSRRATAENQGFKQLKAASTTYKHDLSNWQSHLTVVRRGSHKVKLPGLNNKEESIFDQLATAYQRVPLDEKHHAVIAGLSTLGTAIWVQDHHLLQTHTVLLKRLKEQGSVEIVGVFDTNSPGSNVSQPNCYMFPMEAGAWRVFRFGAGTVEHASWSQDGKGFTQSFYNRRPTLEAASVVSNAKKLSKGGYEFSMLKDAVDMVQRDLAGDVDLKIDIPAKLAARKAVVRQTGNGMIAIEVARSAEDPELDHWNSSDKKGHWTQVIPVQANPVETGGIEYDNLVRCMETRAGKPAGWAVAKENGNWTHKNPSSIKTVLQSFGMDKSSAEIVMGTSERNPWMLVSIPFTPEYPGDRSWNHNAPQLAVQPAPPNDDEESQHPHWDLVLDHIGSALNKTLRESKWAIEVGITCGRQYLQAWYANVLRNPYAPLPYLFLYGQQNAGKSMFHEALSLLVTSGVVKADLALTSSFNAELEGCIVAVVEEKDISRVKGAHDKIKDAVTSPELTIRRMRTDAYQVKNTTHWCQMSNSIDACPVFPGDTRITVIHVPELTTEIPKFRLMQTLREEAPAFLTTLLNMRLPVPQGRLQLPIVITDERSAIIAGNKTVIELFVDEHCELERNNKILFADFYDALKAAYSTEDLSKQRVSKELLNVKGVTVRSGSGNKRYVVGLKLKGQNNNND